jgi:hypothetical protein
MLPKTIAVIATTNQNLIFASIVDSSLLFPDGSRIAWIA